MLKKLCVKGFKCFDTIEIPLGMLNVFSGPNSSGKSSAIQAFLLLCNNAVHNSSSPLNGMWLRLGTFDECRNHRTNARAFSVSTESGTDIFGVEFLDNSEDDKNDVSVKIINDAPEIRKLLNFENQHVFYIPANRGGPEDSYPKNFDRVNFLGNKAEFIIDYLYKNRKKEIATALILDNSSVTLEYQVNYWLGKLFRIRNKIQDLGLSNSLSLEFSLDNGKYIRPYHMGSGISFTIGVIVSCLSAIPGDLVIVENPEIHLHPKAQSALTEFLCFVARAGVQVIVETHSDHVFNGIRKTIVKGEIAHHDVAVHFFQHDNDLGAKSTLISLNEHGRVMEHVKGLFDQFDEDLDSILGI